MLSLFRHGPDQSASAHHHHHHHQHNNHEHHDDHHDNNCSPTDDSETISGGKTISSESSGSPVRSLESPLVTNSRAAVDETISTLNLADVEVSGGGGECPEDLTMPRRRATCSSTSSSSSMSTAGDAGCFKCSTCSNEFPNESALRAHTITRHATHQHRDDDQSSVRCHLCDVLLLNPNYLQKHLEEAHGKRSSQQLATIIRQSNNDNNNASASTNQESSAIKCPECSDSFPNEIALRGHLFDSHMTFSGPPDYVSQFLIKNSGVATAPPFDAPNAQTTTKANAIFCSLCKRGFGNDIELWTHMRFQHLHDTTAVNSLLNLQAQGGSPTPIIGNGDHVSGVKLENVFGNNGGLSPSPSNGCYASDDQLIDGAGDHVTNNQLQQQNKIFNPEAYCEICDKEFCNKYFLKTHKANKHNVYSDDMSSPASMVILQKNHSASAGLLEYPGADGSATPPLINSSTAASASSNEGGAAKDVRTPSSFLDQINVSNNNNGGSPGQMTGATGFNGGNSFSPSPDLFCPLCRQYFPNQLFLQSHIFTAHGGGAMPYGPAAALNPAAMYAMMTANPFLQQMRFIHPQMAAVAMLGMIPPPSASVSPHFLGVASGQQQQMPPMNGSVADYAATPTPVSSQNGGGSMKKSDLSGTGLNGNALSSSFMAAHKDAFCDICRKEFCNKYFLKTHKYNKHGILDDSLPNESSPGSKKQKGSPDLCQQLQYGGNEVEAGEVVKRKSSVDYLATSKSSPLSDALNKPPLNNNCFKSELAYDVNNCQPPPAKMAKSDLLLSGLGLVPQTAADVAQQQQQQQSASCTLCMKSFPSLFALVAHKYRDHGSFDGNIGALAAAMNFSSNGGGQSSPIMQQAKMENSPPRAINGSHSAGGQSSTMASSSVPSSVDPDAYCEICKKEFCSKYFLRTHKLNIHGIVMECSPTTQTTNGHHGNHQSTMIGSTASGKDSSTPKSFRPMATGKNFCDICNKELCNKYFLRTHMLKMHGIVIDENKTVIGNINTLDKETHGQMMFRCDFCNKELGTRQQLKIHKQTIHSAMDSTSPVNGSTACADLSNKMMNGVKDHGVAMPPNVTACATELSLKPECFDKKELIASTSTIIDQSETARLGLPVQTNRQYSEFAEVCTLCNQRFKNVKWLRAHMVTDHGNMQQWSEKLHQFSSSSFNDRNEFSDAVDITSSVRCEYCSERFVDQVDLQMHVIDVHQKEVQGRATSLAEQAALDNIGAYSNQQSSGSSCGVGGAATPTSTSEGGEPCDLTTTVVPAKVLSSEESICATVDEIASGCTPTMQQQQQSEERDALRRNALPMVARNPNGTKMYKCSFCNYYTRWISNLSTHEKRHNPSQQTAGCDRPFICRVCLRAYRYAHSLQRHTEVHRLSSFGMQMQMNSALLASSPADNSALVRSPMTNNVSGLCGNVTTPAGNVSPLKLSSHANGSAEQQQHRCSFCEKTFSNREVYRMHMWTIHKTSPPKDGGFSLSTVGVASSSSTAANNFASSNSPRKIYRCKLCGLGAKVYQDLCNHLTESHGITPKQKSASSLLITPTKSIQCNQDRQIRSDEKMFSNTVVVTPNKIAANGVDKLSTSYPIVSHGTPQRANAQVGRQNLSAECDDDDDDREPRPPPLPPFVMQPFFMKETADSGVFVPSVVYLPVTREIDAVSAEATFTFYPIRANDNANGITSSDEKHQDYMC